MTDAPGVEVMGDATDSGVPLFSNLAVSLGAGQWTCLLGPSGVGKSTVLRLIAGLNTHVTFAGSLTTTDGLPTANRVAFMAQQHLLFPWATILENIATGPRLRGDRPDHDRCRFLLGEVGLTAHAQKRPHELSGGERQRAALARTLMEDRPIILLDEPFSALDARTRAEMQELAAELLAGRTVLLVTHDPAEAARMGSRIYVMTSAGLEEAETPPAPPIRDIDDPATLQAQGRLHRRLLGRA
jgi:putative hydroxymethylpyrimidine transport system ATP-binding protein